MEIVCEPVTSPAFIVSPRRMAVYSVSRVAALSAASTSPSASVSVVTTKTTLMSSSKAWPSKREAAVLAFTAP